tara:strand:- start:762 stop:1262 length:501 start_codon:yes stop_codon:yes gene_type:complete
MIKDTKKKLRVTIPEYKPNNNNNNNKNKNKKTTANVNRSNVPTNLKKNCYAKGISMYQLNNHKVTKKNVSVLKSQCASKNANKNANKNVKRYGVPPKPERVLAIMQLNNSKPSFKNAVRFANDPFYNFGNPVYLPVSPIPYSRKTWPTKKQHVVYTILPKYFPGKQ